MSHKQFISHCDKLRACGGQRGPVLPEAVREGFSRKWHFCQVKTGRGDSRGRNSKEERPHRKLGFPFVVPWEAKNYGSWVRGGRIPPGLLRCVEAKDHDELPGWSDKGVRDRPLQPVLKEGGDRTQAVRGPQGLGQYSSDRWLSSRNKDRARGSSLAFLRLGGQGPG